MNRVTPTDVRPQCDEECQTKFPSIKINKNTTVYRVIFPPCYFRSSTLANGFALSSIYPDTIYDRYVFPNEHSNVLNLPSLKFTC